MLNTPLLLEVQNFSTCWGKGCPPDQSAIKTLSPEPELPRSIEHCAHVATALWWVGRCVLGDSGGREGTLEASARFLLDFTHAPFFFADFVWCVLAIVSHSRVCMRIC